MSYVVCTDDIVKASSFDIILDNSENSIIEKKTEQPSASHRKFGATLLSLSKGYNISDKDTSDSDTSDNSDNEVIGNEDCPDWIINVSFMQNALENVGVCKNCHKTLKIVECKQFRAGVATKMSIQCTNVKCNTYEDFFTTKKSGKLFDLNQKSVLAFRTIGKGNTSAKKVISVLSLSTPINRQSWSEQTAYFEQKTFALKDDCLKRAGKLLKKKAMEEDAKLKEKDIFDIATSFDGSWQTPGWSSSKGIVSAIAENTSQVLDISYKCNYCTECQKMKERKRNGDLSELSYLEWFVNHEEKCMCNHEGSAQVIIKIINLFNKLF